MFSDFPSSALFDRTSWETQLQDRYRLAHKVVPPWTLWLTFFAVDQSCPDPPAALLHLLRTILSTIPTVDLFLFTLPAQAPICGAVSRVFSAVEPADPLDTGAPSVWSCTSATVVPALAIRNGRVEDYDDLLPLLNVSEGCLTDIPEGFYLDELLENQVVPVASRPPFVLPRTHSWCFSWRIHLHPLSPSCLVVVLVFTTTSC